MGTHCFFNESSRPGGIEDACFQEKPAVLHDYFGKTNKVLKMRRIFVDEKETDGEDGLAEGETENLDHLQVTKTYEEALNQFLKSGEKPPREIIEIAEPTDTEESSITLERQPNSERTLEVEMFKLAVEPTEQDSDSDVADTDSDLKTE